MHKKITNHYRPGDKQPKLCTEQVTVWEPKPEWSYAHHPHITWFRGYFYLMFSNGHCHEDDVGQRILYCRSEDSLSWSEPEVLVDSEQGTYANTVLAPGCWYTDGEKLTAFYVSFEYREDWLENGSRLPGSEGQFHFVHYQMTTEDGIHWSSPQESSNVGSNHDPIRLSSGRLLCAGGVEFGLTEDSSGLGEWRKISCCEKSWRQVPADDCVKTPSVREPGLVDDQTVDLCEGAFLQQDDGTIWLFLRSGTPWLWASKSVDDGETWSLPEPTRFSDNRTKFALGRLPGGRYYYVGTPDPFPPRTRHVLVLSLSEDGNDFDQHFILADAQYKGRYPGIDKNGIYGYPSTLVRDGYLHVAFSICKEKIAVLRLPCDTL